MKSFLSLSVLLLGVAVNAAPAAQGSSLIGTTTTTTVTTTDSTTSTTRPFPRVGSHPVAPIASSSINKRSLDDDKDSVTTTLAPVTHNIKSTFGSHIGFSSESKETSTEDAHGSTFGSSSTSGSSFHPLSSSFNSRPARDTFNPSVTTHDITTTPKTDDKSEEDTKTPGSTRFSPSTSKVSSTSN